MSIIFEFSLYTFILQPFHLQTSIMFNEDTLPLNPNTNKGGKETWAMNGTMLYTPHTGKRISKFFFFYLKFPVVFNNLPLLYKNSFIRPISKIMFLFYKLHESEITLILSFISYYAGVQWISS